MIAKRGQWLGCVSTCFAGNSNRAVEPAWRRVKRSLRYTARTITDDPEVRKDLLQEALVEMWVIDPTRFDFRDRKEVAYLKRMLINRMWDVWRKEQPWHEVERS